MRMLSIAVSVLAFGLLGNTIAAAAPGCTNLQQDEHKFYSLRSFRGDLTTAGAHVVADFQFPDRYRWTMGAMTGTIIGTNGWMSVNGHVMVMPAPMVAMLQTRLQSIRSLGLQGNLAYQFTVTPTGTQMLDGVLTCTYHLVKKTGDYLLDWWIAKDEGLPLKAVATVSGRTATILYSDYNEPLEINAP